ncbi:MAG TPA: Rieske 2Fe-2S domain-containing protein [Anaerolineae bacterium]|nr:Rieske 2Fe-2S domain-containing protein [Anaerolineae bacterium]HNU04056.1 Rieske 2Fe-2S domain-containing protein [Anaerolineae bacterium]
MANPKSSGPGEELSPEQQKFAETKQQQTAGGAEYRGDRGQYLKSGRQQKEEEKAAKKTAKPPAPPLSRREFLNYAWGAALGVVLVEAGVATYLFALPRFKEGEFGGIFPLGAGASMPAVDAPPMRNLEGQFWLSNDADGVRALYRVCTHLGCLYEWKDQTFRFECPCHGSKFVKDGQYIEGPAPRSLDQFKMQKLVNGQVVEETTTGGQALTVEATAEYVVDTGVVIKGQPV